jgi:hypothetical protein
VIISSVSALTGIVHCASTSAPVFGNHLPGDCSGAHVSRSSLNGGTSDGRIGINGCFVGQTFGVSVGNKGRYPPAPPHPPPHDPLGTAMRPKLLRNAVIPSDRDIADSCVIEVATHHLSPTFATHPTYCVPTGT